MQKLEKIAEQIRQTFDTLTVARDQALTQARALTRACALSIRAVHRDESDVMLTHLEEARQLANALRTGLADYPALFYAGYTQDSLKEFAEAVSLAHSSATRLSPHRKNSICLRIPT